MGAYRGDVAGIIQHARQALEYLPEQDLTWRSIAAMALARAIAGTRALSAKSEPLNATRILVKVNVTRASVRIIIVSHGAFLNTFMATLL